MNFQTKHITIFILGVLLTLVFYLKPPAFERIVNIQNYLITVGGIISALVIAYFSAKIFNLKIERENRQTEIDKLGYRLTGFRQLLYFVMKSRDFWLKYNDIKKFKMKYPDLNRQRLTSIGEDKLKYEFYFEQTEISQNTIALYTAMEIIYDIDEIKSDSWAFERTIIERYNIDDLSKYLEPCNQIWYFLEGRYAKHGVGLFDDEGLSIIFTEKFQEKISIADINMKGKDFHRVLLANLGSEFYEFVIPKMIELIKQNTGIPNELRKTFYSLLAIMVFGVIFPLILMSISVNSFLNIRLTLIFVNLTILSLVFFLFEFYSLLKDEIDTNKKNI